MQRGQERPASGTLIAADLAWEKFAVIASGWTQIIQR